MKWQGRRGSRNIEDRRRSGGMRKVGGIGGIGMIAILLIGYFLGVDVTPLLNGGNQGGVAPRTGATTGTLSAEEKAAGQFVSVTLADTEEIWGDIFRKQVGKPYTPATLVLFSGATASACGGANGSTGPFYCPLDKKVYLDTAFFTTLSRRMGAKGDFAAAYVVAHEIGHHVQDELGILSESTAIRRQLSEADSNAVSVRVELQADCYAGLWARQAQAKFGTLERGDIEEAMNAAGRIGDDTLQRNAGRRPMPDSFTHGTSEQRQRWFLRGFKSGDLAACNTFNANPL